MRALSKADLKPSRANMHGAASLWKEKQTLSLPPTCTQLVLCEKGKFALDGEFSKNAPYKQKIIFHLTSIGKMSRKIFFFALDGRAVVCFTHVYHHVHSRGDLFSLRCPIVKRVCNSRLIRTKFGWSLGGTVVFFSSKVLRQFFFLNLRFIIFSCALFSSIDPLHI